MAFMAGLMAHNAGDAQGRAQAYQDAINLSMQQQQINESQREFDQNLKLQQEQLGIDPSTGQPIKPIIPKQFSQVLPGNKGKGTPTAQDYVNHYLQLAAANVGNPIASQAFTNIAQQWGLGADRAANAQYTLQGRLPLAQSQASLADAHAQYILNIQPQQFKAKLGEDKEKYLAEIASRQELAAYSAGARMQIAAVTAYYRMQNQTQENAFRAAIDEYNQSQQTYRTDLRDSLNPLSPSYGTTPTQPGAPMSFPYTTPTGGNNVTINLGDILKAINGQNKTGNGSSSSGGGNKPPANTGDAIVDTLVSSLHGRKDAAAQISMALAANAITQDEAVAAAKRLNVNLNAPNTGIQLPTLNQALGIGGGSNAAAPFP